MQQLGHAWNGNAIEPDEETVCGLRRDVRRYVCARKNRTSSQSHDRVCSCLPCAASRRSQRRDAHHLWYPTTPVVSRPSATTGRRGRPAHTRLAARVLVLFSFFSFSLPSRPTLSLVSFLSLFYSRSLSFLSTGVIWIRLYTGWETFILTVLNNFCVVWLMRFLLRLAKLRRCAKRLMNNSVDVTFSFKKT